MHIILVSPFLFVQIEYTSIFVLIRRQNLEAEEFKWENLSCSKMTEYIIVDDDVPMELVWNTEFLPMLTCEHA